MHLQGIESRSSSPVPVNLTPFSSCFPSKLLYTFLISYPRPCGTFPKMLLYFTARICKPLATPPSRRTASCRLSPTTYIYAATLRIWTPSPLPATRGRPVQWGTGIHLRWTTYDPVNLISLMDVTCSRNMQRPL